MQLFQSKQFYIGLGVLLIVFAGGYLYRQSQSNSSFSESEILGEDLNRDGVRDDVEKYIDALPDVSENLKKAMKQFARALQAALRVGDGPEARGVSREIFKSVVCLSRMESDKTTDWQKKIKNKMMNTSDRSRRYIKFNGALSGKMLGGSLNGACDFEKKKRRNKNNRVNDEDDDDIDEEKEDSGIE